ncbi:MAG: N-acetylmuramoyl-L-alanine amidase [Lachnospiraceae bacterium]|nr:N-acetylmuramoyl-L-alanine amidase [Lachnospiraceae bacterium]
MRRKRIRSVLAMVLALSMVFGSNVSALADEITDNPAPVSENMTQPPSGEETQPAAKESENAADPAEEAGEPLAETPEPSDEKPAENADPEKEVPDSVSADLEVPEKEAPEAEAEESAGAGDDIKLFVSADTVSYDGKSHGVYISANRAEGYTFTAWMISANDGKTEPSQYSEADFRSGSGISKNGLAVSTTAKEFEISDNSAVNAGRYAVSVNAEKNGKVSANAVVFLSVNKAGPISLSINGKTKYYDGSSLVADAKDLYEIDGKTLYGNDMDLIKVSGSQNSAGESGINVDVSAIAGNYEIKNVSAGKLTVLSTNLVIRSKDFRKNFDRKAVTQAEREGFTIEADGADVNTLSKNLALDATCFNWDKSSLISGDTVTASQNRFELNEEGKKRIYGVSNNKAGNFASVRLVSGNITIIKKEHEWTSNGLTAPVISSVKQNAKGFVTITWKAARTYKNKEKKDRKKSSSEKKMDQARYMIYRYDDVNEDWILLNGANKSKAADKESDIKFGQTGTKFVDKEAGREDISTYIYKVNVIGYDSDTKYGMAKEPSYGVCQPMGLGLTMLQHDRNSMDFRFSKIRGTETYVIERSLTGKKNDFDDAVISVSADQIDNFDYYGSKLASPLTYKNNGEPVKKGSVIPAEGVFITDRSLDAGDTYHYRAYVKTEVVDFAEDGSVLPERKELKSAVSNVVKSKLRFYAPYVVSAGTPRFDRAAIAFEALSEDIIPTGSAKKYSKNKYEILQSTSPTGGFKVVATVTGKDLDADEVTNLTKVAANREISLNGVKYKAPYPTYIYLVKGLAPEKNYYFKVRVVLDKVTGFAGESVCVKPQMGDVTSISANVDNYNKVTVNTDFVTGAKEMVITYRATKTHTGTVLSENSNKDSTWKRKVFTIKRDSNKDPITKFGITGLKHGYTYEFYAEPKNGKRHVSADPKKAVATTKVGAPKLSTAPKDMDEVYVSWQEVKGATKYMLRVYDVENHDALVAEKVFKKPGKHTWRGGTGGSLDPKKGKTDMDLVGKPYRFEVCAFRKDSYFSSGEWGLVAQKTDSGRPTGVKNLKAQLNRVAVDNGYTYYPDGFLTWDHSADFSQSTPLGYMVERKVYKYKTNTEDSFEKNCSSSVVLFTKEEAKKRLDNSKKDGKYVSYKGFRNKQTKNLPFYHGDKVVYVVTPVYQSATTKKYGRGPEKDGFILGVPKKVTYITPYKIKLTNTEVTVGQTKEVPISFLPKSTTLKDVVWTAPGQKYFTLEGSKVKGKTAMSKWNKEVYVQATGRISISGSSIISNHALIKVNPIGTGDGKLKVCIDAGHGGSDSGATNNGLLEKTCNLAMANAMKAELEKYNVPVVMTRYDDTYLTVGDRPNIAYSNGCNLFISIHCNSGGGHGTEVWKSITEYHDDALANRILSKVTAAIGTESRGVKTRTGSNGDYYGVIRGSAANKITGMIVEVAFIDGDYSKLNNGDMREAAGRAIADAVLESRGYK